MVVSSVKHINILTGTREHDSFECEGSVRSSSSQQNKRDHMKTRPSGGVSTVDSTNDGAGRYGKSTHSNHT
jgi:hypothetical protein